jgi:hypothetical protein
MEKFKHIPLVFPRVASSEQLRASQEFLSRMSARRSVRFFVSLRQGCVGTPQPYFSRE